MDAQSQNTSAQPDPVGFDDYRAYLLAMIDWLRRAEPRFSYRWFSRRAGFKAPNYLKLVAEGQRNLALASIDRFARGLGLDSRDHEAFERLVRFAHASTDAERNRIYAAIREARGAAPVRRLAAEAFDLYTRWWTVVVRELVAVSPVGADAGWFAQTVLPRLRPTQARGALDRLQRLGLIERARRGWVVGNTKISTGGEVASLAVRNFHRSMLGLAAQALDRVPRDRRHVSAITVPLTEAQYGEVTRRLAEVRRELLEAVEEGEGGPRRIYQLQFAVFPVSKEVE